MAQSIGVKTVRYYVDAEWDDICDLDKEEFWDLISGMFNISREECDKIYNEAYL